jgi:hypothetical protein
MELSTVSINHAERIISRLMKHEDHLSYSSLCAFKQAPAIFMNYKMGIKEETPAMIFGSMVHCLVLEPQDFENRYFCLDDQDICVQIGGAKPRATNQYKAWKEVAMQEAEGKKIVETNDYTAAKIIASNVLHNRASKKILDLGWEHEQPIDWEFKNFRFKGFIDGMGEKMIFDLKTCADADPKKFQRNIIDNSYYLQAAMYLYAKGGMLDYYIIAVDKTGGVSVHKLEKHLIEHGMEEYNKLLDHFNHCILKDAFDQSYDFWAERSDGIYTAEKPKWLY